MITMNDLKKYTEELSKKITFNTENLYQHTISLNVDSGKRIVFDIINENANDMTLAEVKKYIKDNYSTTSADVLTYARFMPCVGVASNYTAVGFAWATNRGGWVIVYPVSGGLDWSGVNDGSNIFILAQKTRTLALNNVLRPSIQEYTTNLNYNGSKIADIKWTLLKTPMPNGKFLYKWTASGSGNVSVAWTVWSSSVSWSYCSKMVSALFPSGYGSKIQNSIVYDLDITNVSCSCCKNTTSSNVNCYFERPTGYDTATRTIKFKAQAEYIDA